MSTSFKLAKSLQPSSLVQDTDWHFQWLEAKAREDNQPLGHCSDFANVRYYHHVKLWTLYDFTSFYFGQKPNKDNSYGVVEYTLQAYVPSDLDLFFAVFNTFGIDERPILDSFDGGAVQNINESSGYNANQT
jgi:hypothetical protein